MGDLISRSVLIEKIKERIELGIYHGASFFMLELFTRMVESTPTAYNLDEVVEQLEKQAEQYRHRAIEHEEKGFQLIADKNYSKACSYEHAIEIVKAGVKKMSNQHEMIRDLFMDLFMDIFMDIREEEELSPEDKFEDLKRRVKMGTANMAPREPKHCLTLNEYRYLKELHPELDDLLNFEILEPVEISPIEELPQRYSIPNGRRQKPKKDRTATKKKYRFKKKKKR